MNQSIAECFQTVFGAAPQVLARAPGRIEFLGNHTDYNGGDVLGAAIDRFVWVGAAKNSEERFRFHTIGADNVVEWRADVDARPVGSEAWVNYPLGVWRSLGDFNLPRPKGFDLVVAADLPAGAGLSSSAALELATALALLRLAAAPEPDRALLAEIGRAAENRYVGVPCGILDQGTSAYGEAGKLVHIACHGPRFSKVSFPSSLSLWVFNTREKHALIDGLYAARHRECLEAAHALGVDFLCDLRPGADFDGKLSSLPANLAKRAKHVVDEHARVRMAVAALERGDLGGVGALLLASHASSQLLFENSTPALDTLVAFLRAQRGVIGARLTGGGFGGAVMALTDASFNGVEDVRRRYAAVLGRAPEVIQLSTADGAHVL